MAAVTLENLTRLYPAAHGAVKAVDDISLEIRDGEFMVFVGPSGCGKSTTLRMIAGLEEISGGTITIDGRRVNHVLPKDRDIAMVFQNYALYPHMSVFENMAFGLKLRKHPKPEIVARVHEAASLLGLEPYLDRKPKALSGGQRQRVAVGRAIVRKPKVFLFDEPLSNLDAKMRAAMRAELAGIHRRLGATMIYVTHDQVEAMTMGDRICVMDQGRIMQVAEPLHLYHAPAHRFVAGFIGSPPMNFIAGTVAPAGTTLAFVPFSAAPTARWQLPLEGSLADRAANYVQRPVTLGVRPEHVHMARTPVSSLAGAALSARVTLIEPMGAETVLHLQLDDTPLVAKVRPDERFAIGDRVPLALDHQRIHLFDDASGRALVSAEQPCSPTGHPLEASAVNS